MADAGIDEGREEDHNSAKNEGETHFAGTPGNNEGRPESDPPSSDKSKANGGNWFDAAGNVIAGAINQVQIAIGKIAEIVFHFHFENFAGCTLPILAAFGGVGFCFLLFIFAVRLPSGALSEIVPTTADHPVTPIATTPPSTQPAQVVMLVLPTTIQIGLVQVEKQITPTYIPSNTPTVPTPPKLTPTATKVPKVVTSRSSITLGPIIGSHLVQPRETVYCIARAYRILPEAIAQANDLIWPAQLFIGEMLLIPDNPWPIVPSGETCPRQFGD